MPLLENDIVNYRVNALYITQDLRRKNMVVEVNWENFASNNNNPDGIQRKFENLCRQLFTNEFLKENKTTEIYILTPIILALRQNLYLMNAPASTLAFRQNILILVWIIAKYCIRWKRQYTIMREN